MRHFVEDDGKDRRHKQRGNLECGIAHLPSASLK
jgi:hypothetical protein